MLDTNFCSFIIRGFPEPVLRHLDSCHRTGHQILISVITYYEMRLGTVGKKASPKLAGAVESFTQRLDSVLPWSREAADAATRIYAELSRSAKVIGPNDTMIAGHALAADCILVTNNTREFRRVPGLTIEDWTPG